MVMVDKSIDNSFLLGTYESQHENITLQTKGPVGYGQGTEAKNFDDKYNAVYKGTIRGIRRIKVWTQQYDGEVFSLFYNYLK